MKKSKMTRIKSALKDPNRLFRYLKSIVRAKCFLLSCRLRGKRVVGGDGLRIFGRLKINGPGQVVLGKNVRVSMDVTPYTYSQDAVISIGDNVFLNGTRFGCVELIKVGNNCILGDARIMDTNFHSVYSNRHEPDAPVGVKPVILEENVWVGSQAGILPGTKIGKNSVVAFGAVCSGRFKRDRLIIGNPARSEFSLPEPKSKD